MLAEEYRLGGTCVIRGCVPKKLLVYASSFSAAFEDSRGYGWSPGEPIFDWKSLIDAKDREIARLEDLYGRNLDAAGVKHCNGRARVADPHTVETESDGTFRARHILVATGGVPFVPDIPGADFAITSNEVFHLEELPNRVIVVGGGYIACEFAGILNGLGSEVIQFYRGEQILRGFDDGIRETVARGMRGRGVRLHVGTDVNAIAKSESGLVVSTTGGNGNVENRMADLVLYATGRRPNSGGIGLESAGVELGRRGEIKVDAWSRTAVPSIYAVGDVTDRLNLTPVAIREAEAFVRTVFEGTPVRPDHEVVPTAVFTQPEVGTVGLSEYEARVSSAGKGGVDIFQARFRPMSTALSGRDEVVLAKLVVARESRKVLGCHIVGAGAAEMIQLAGIPVKMGATKDDFDRTVAVHPTMAEELVTLKVPVETATEGNSP